MISSSKLSNFPFFGKAFGKKGTLSKILYPVLYTQDLELLNLSCINPFRPNKEESRALDLRVNAGKNLVSEASGEKIDSGINVALGRVPFVRTERPGNSRRNENFRSFYQSHSARSVKVKIACTKEIAETLGERPISFSK